MDDRSDIQSFAEIMLAYTHLFEDLDDKQVKHAMRRDYPWMMPWGRYCSEVNYCVDPGEFQ